MLNPIEEFFSKFKKMLRKTSTQTEKDLIESIKNIFNNFEEKDIKAYTRYSFSFMKNSLDFIDLI